MTREQQHQLHLDKNRKVISLSDYSLLLSVASPGLCWTVFALVFHDRWHCKSVLQLNVLSDKVKHLRKQQFWWEKKSIHHKVSQRKWQYVQTSVHALYTAYGLKSYRSHFKTIMPEQKYACYHSISLTKSLGLSSLYLQISWLSVGSSVMLMQVWPPPIPPSTITPPPPQDGKGFFS